MEFRARLLFPTLYPPPSGAEIVKLGIPLVSSSYPQLSWPLNKWFYCKNAPFLSPSSPSGPAFLTWPAPPRDLRTLADRVMRQEACLLSSRSRSKRPIMAHISVRGATYHMPCRQVSVLQGPCVEERNGAHGLHPFLHFSVLVYGIHYQVRIIVRIPELSTGLRPWKTNWAKAGVYSDGVRENRPIGDLMPFSLDHECGEGTVSPGGGERRAMRERICQHHTPSLALRTRAYRDDGYDYPLHAASSQFPVQTTTRRLAVWGW